MPIQSALICRASTLAQDVDETKATWPGRKQVYRSHGDTGLMRGDVLTTLDAVQPGKPLLQPVMQQGKRLAGSVVREYARAELATLAAPLRALTRAPSAYPVTVAQTLRLLAAEVDRRFPAPAGEARCN